MTGIRCGGNGPDRQPTGGFRVRRPNPHPTRDNTVRRRGRVPSPARRDRHAHDAESGLRFEYPFLGGSADRVEVESEVGVSLSGSEIKRGFDVGSHSRGESAGRGPGPDRQFETGLAAERQSPATFPFGRTG